MRNGSPGSPRGGARGWIEEAGDGQAVLLLVGAQHALRAHALIAVDEAAGEVDALERDLVRRDPLGREHVGVERQRTGRGGVRDRSDWRLRERWWGLRQRVGRRCGGGGALLEFARGGIGFLSQLALEFLGGGLGRGRRSGNRRLHYGGMRRRRRGRALRQ